MSRQFADRTDAGRALAAAILAHLEAEFEGEFGDLSEVIVLGLPRGGVPVAAVVAEALGAPLDVVAVRKVGVPTQSEVAMGAIASLAGTVVTVRSESVLRAAGADAQARFDEIAARERVELERRQEVYRAGRAPLDIAGRTVILVDDGIATGATMRAAIEALASAGTASIIVGVPVGPKDTLVEIERLVDRVVCVTVPDPFWAVGQAYVDFSQTADEEVTHLLGA